MAHEVVSTPRLNAALDRLRPVVAALPGAHERLSHGSPTFFCAEGRRARTFASLHDEREWFEGRLCLWFAAPEGLQEALIAGDPARYFIPPYVGHRGWGGLRLDLPTPTATRRPANWKTPTRSSPTAGDADGQADPAFCVTSRYPVAQEPLRGATAASRP